MPYPIKYVIVLIPCISRKQVKTILRRYMMQWREAVKNSVILIESPYSATKNEYQECFLYILTIRVLQHSTASKYHLIIYSVRPYDPPCAPDMAPRWCSLDTSVVDKWKHSASLLAASPPSHLWRPQTIWCLSMTYSSSF